MIMMMKMMMESQHHTFYHSQPAYLHSFLHFHEHFRSLWPSNVNLFTVPFVRTVFGTQLYCRISKISGIILFLQLSTPAPVLIHPAIVSRLTTSSKPSWPHSHLPKRLKLDLSLTPVRGYKFTDFLPHLAYLLAYLPKLLSLSDTYLKHYCLNVHLTGTSGSNGEFLLGSFQKKIFDWLIGWLILNIGV